MLWFYFIIFLSVREPICLEKWIGELFTLKWLHMPIAETWAPPTHRAEFYCTIKLTWTKFSDFLFFIFFSVATSSGNQSGSK